MKQYTGAALCIGCGISGTELPRLTRNSLCHVCSDDLKRGRVDRTVNFGYCTFFQHFHAYINRDTNILLHIILQSLHNPDIPNDQMKRVDPFVNVVGTNGKYYIIPLTTYIPLKDFFDRLDKTITEFKNTNRE